MKKAIRVGDLRDFDALEKRLSGIVEWKNLTVVNGYRAEPVAADAMIAWLHKWGDRLLPYVTDTTVFLRGAVAAGKNIMFEAQLGALRDIDYGIYPYTSASSTVANYAPIGAGIPGARLDSVVGVMKAYSTCVGEGPFTCELFGDDADQLREAGGEYGAATGRPRRVGGFDIPASRYGCIVQGADEIALTKLDVLSYLDKIPVCVAYEIDGVRTSDFPTGEPLNRAKPVYEFLDGWHCDISACRSRADLPENARRYVDFIASSVGCRVRYVSVGADRDAYIDMLN